MRFTLEALFAHHGDALILHYGTKEDPHWMVVDGGPSGAYDDVLKPRLEQIRQSWNYNEKSLPLDMVMVSHVDDDHLGGILELFDDQVRAHDQQRQLPYSIGRLWHNSLDDLLDHRGEDVVARMAQNMREEPVQAQASIGRTSGAVVASVPQGRRLQQAAAKLGMSTNAPFQGLLTAPAERTVELSHGLRLTVVGPSRERVDAFQRAWQQDLTEILEGVKDPARASAFADERPFYLGSLVTVAELEGKRMLLTGDASGDDILRGLESAGIKQPGVPIHFDVFKLPQHGSHEHVSQAFFEQVTADVYVISGNGLHGSPEPAMLKMLAKARAGSPYQLRLTFTRNSSRELDDPIQAKAMRRIERWIKKRRPSNCSIKHRHRRNRSRSIHIDLGDVALDY